MDENTEEEKVIKERIGVTLNTIKAVKGHSKEAKERNMGKTEKQGRDEGRSMSCVEENTIEQVQKR